ncbi:DUF2252 domain-containing protein [Sporolactobacillus pectinivorans]|uniref:DUF2252 domain-containing protein n=1 Tax=Sporolactobacillus pectinivorans TaxID=1591408 RepID=UPI000C25BFEF|nr:DUF2252 domain-containing protein [Sporolactobacillus pectinivorans]
MFSIHNNSRIEKSIAEKITGLKMGEQSMSLFGLDEKTKLERMDALKIAGKQARKKVPFSDQAMFVPVDRDPVAIVDEGNQERLPELLMLRRERMSASPFAFYRGTAGLMAHDLVSQAVTGKQVIICGDAHIGNFGFYASPERRLIFDLNDFDESALGPWEWDVRRLVTSVILCGESLGFREDQIDEAAMQAAYSYRNGLRSVLSLDALGRFYLSIDEAEIQKILTKPIRKAFDKAAREAKKRTSGQVIKKLTEIDDRGRIRFTENPPVLTHVDAGMVSKVHEYFDQYRKNVAPDIALFLSQHILTDVARRVVGIGSVGTRCYLLVLTSTASSHLVLQIKEAEPSAIKQYCPPDREALEFFSREASEGYRVVACQEILQAVSDPFLGYFQANGRDFYVRQYRDMKGSVELEKLSATQLDKYVAGCGLLLARAHAQSPNAAWIKGYMGKSDAFDRSMLDWSKAYAHQVQNDYESFVKLD